MSYGNVLYKFKLNYKHYAEYVTFPTFFLDSLIYSIYTREGASQPEPARQVEIRKEADTERHSPQQSLAERAAPGAVTTVLVRTNCILPHHHHNNNNKTVFFASNQQPTSLTQSLKGLYL